MYQDALLQSVIEYANFTELIEHEAGAQETKVSLATLPEEVSNSHQRRLARIPISEIGRTHPTTSHSWCTSTSSVSATGLCKQQSWSC